ncbi:cuticle protein 19 [Procambarus clarkii]|uniref:cuticle protein 19 n=1 Tax=Procambarus clarkii TaxID=6728 RepID=UPI001E675ACE|nr:cuticle protein 19-like [Procambarus clarkii]
MDAHKVLLMTVTLTVMLSSAVLAVPQLLDHHATVPRYEFGYEVNAPDYGNDFAHAERRDGPDTSGEYRVLLPDGRVQVVSYTVSGDSGYVAQVSYQ